MSRSAQTAHQLDIVIPTLNAAEGLPRTLDALAEGAPREILVVDGGSSDETRNLALRGGARLLSSERGRGQQLRSGAAAAQGDWLLFLHADTRLEPGWWRAATAFMDDPANRRRAAVFRLRLDSPRPEARKIEALAGWRARRLGLAFGDQGLLLTRAFYLELGGYAAIPLMEDFDLIRRIGRRRLVLLEPAAVTSDLRYRQGGWLRRPLRNVAFQLLYLAGCPPRLLARFY